MQAKPSHNPFNIFSKLEAVIRRFLQSPVPPPPQVSSSCSLIQFHDFPSPGEVIYGTGWDTPCQVMSGGFCRIQYLRWRGHLTTISVDPPGTVNFFLRPLGGIRTIRLLLKT